MEKAWTPTEIFERLRRLVADSLGADPETIGLETRLVHDLGAESMDFIDLAALIRRKFGINLPWTQMFPAQRNLRHVPVTEWSTDDTLSAGEIGGLEEIFPGIPSVILLQPGVSHIEDLYTVDFVCRVIAGQLGVDFCLS